LRLARRFPACSRARATRGEGHDADDEALQKAGSVQRVKRPQAEFDVNDVETDIAAHDVMQYDHENDNKRNDRQMTDGKRRRAPRSITAAASAPRAAVTKKIGPTGENANRQNRIEPHMRYLWPLAS
jgi:hypothetical protein